MDEITNSFQTTGSSYSLEKQNLQGEGFELSEPLRTKMEVDSHGTGPIRKEYDLPMNGQDFHSTAPELGFEKIMGRCPMHSGTFYLNIDILKSNRHARLGDIEGGGNLAALVGRFVSQAKRNNASDIVIEFGDANPEFWRSERLKNIMEERGWGFIEQGNNKSFVKRFDRPTPKTKPSDFPTNIRFRLVNTEAGFSRVWGNCKSSTNSFDVHLEVLEVQGNDGVKKIEKLMSQLEDQARRNGSPKIKISFSEIANKDPSIDMLRHKYFEEALQTSKSWSVTTRGTGSLVDVTVTRNLE